MGVLSIQYEKIIHLSDEEFRRLTGVKRITFDTMLSIFGKAHCLKKSRGGRPNKLCVADMLLMTLEYLREYRTYFHIGVNYGVSESYAYKIIRWVEDILIKDGTFSLPSKKDLLKGDGSVQVVLIDASESPILRPKKTATELFWQEKEAYCKVTTNCRTKDKAYYLYSFQ